MRVENERDVHELRTTLRVAPDVRWSDPARGAGRVAVYVDDRYHSDLIGLAERDTPYRLNLAGLGPGEHEVRLYRRPLACAGGW